MSLSLRILTICVSVFFLAYVIFMIRRGRYLLKYSLMWFALGLAGLICAVFPEVVYALSDVLGFETPSNFLLFAIAFFLLVFCLSLCGVLSRQSLKVRKLVQHVSMLEADRACTARDTGDDADAASPSNGKSAGDVLAGEPEVSPR